jgi:hypothetical protein
MALLAHPLIFTGASIIRHAGESLLGRYISVSYYTFMRLDRRKTRLSCFQQLSFRLVRTPWHLVPPNRPTGNLEIAPEYLIMQLVSIRLLIYVLYIEDVRRYGSADQQSNHTTSTLSAPYSHNTIIQSKSLSMRSFRKEARLLYIVKRWWRISNMGCVEIDD